MTNPELADLLDDLAFEALGRAAYFFDMGYPHHAERSSRRAELARTEAKRLREARKKEGE